MNSVEKSRFPTINMVAVKTVMELKDFYIGNGIILSVSYCTILPASYFAYVSYFFIDVQIFGDEYLYLDYLQFNQKILYDAKYINTYSLACHSD